MIDLEYLIVNSKDIIVANTLSSSSEVLIDKIEGPNKLLTVNEIVYRVGKVSNEKGTVYAITVNKDYLRSTRRFTTQLLMILNGLEVIEQAKNDVEAFAFKQVNILIHNLTTINAHSIQDIVGFLPREKFELPQKKFLKEVKKTITEDVDKSADLILKFFKYNSQMKAEFSVFNKLYEENPILNYKTFELFQSVGNVLTNFFPDIIDKEIDLNIDRSEVKGYFDYESVHVAFFHMIDNIIKYILKGTTLNITFEDLLDEVVIRFDMISLKIKEEEKIKIFIDGFSGEFAEKMEKSGKGIGMARVKKLLELNTGSIEVLEGSEQVEDNNYANNIFIVRLKKEGYIR